MITVRRLVPDDWEVFRDLLLECLLAAPYAAVLTYEEAVQRTEAQWRNKFEDRVLFVALLDGVPVGTAGGMFFDEDPTLPELISMWVSPEARGTGASDRLVEQVLAWATGEGHPRMGLWVLDGNVPAEKLYLRHGFARTGRRKAMPRDESLIEVEMLISLDA
ncbi:GNAT family N-acetyltransferase [Nocardia sp. NPDC052566]|uniref:GNAT family N-acetyltransferase n=1 Tax=Nocardia sp. NPDC052566 TaxID=3364330 RepID=UPI0037C9D7B8